MGSATGKIEESKATLENSANEAVFSFGETDVSVSVYFFAIILALSARYEKVSVNVVSKNVETIDSMPVSFTLESCDGNLKVPFKALTYPCQVTGRYNQSNVPAIGLT